MKHKLRTLAAAAFALSYLMVAQCFQPATARAQSAPRTLSYQGVLTLTPSPSGRGQGEGTLGTNTAGFRLLTVTLYSDANGTTKLWQSTMNTQVDSNGVFNCMLGTAENPLPAPQAMDRPIWLGVAVDNGPELRPLSQVTASAYALNVVDNAITTAKLADNAVTSAKIADSSITASKVNMDYISSININGIQFTGHGTSLNIQGENGITAAYKQDSNTLVLSGPNSNAKMGIANGAPGTTNTAPPAGCINSDGGIGTNTVAGGCNNVISSPDAFCFLGGGQNNSIESDDQPDGSKFHVITGGTGNIIIGGDDSAQNGACTIGGGQGNTLVGPWGFIGGGESNIISNANPPVEDDQDEVMTWDVINGGQSNSITNSSSQSTIGGGVGNQIHGVTSGGTLVNTANQSTIGGGNGNTVTNNGATIAGGFSNTASGNVSAVLGGSNNIAAGQGSTIGGGAANTIDITNTTGLYSAIGGGESNKAGRMTFVGGGFENDATGITVSTPNIDASATLGGSNLITSGQDQVVFGCLNQPSGHGHFTISAGMPNDDRILEVGSPVDINNLWTRHNAFEVSYNGHSIVTQTNGSSLPGAGGQPSVFQGATYIESPVYAWGEIDETGNPIGTGNFGITQVIPLWPTFTPTVGTYLVTLAPADPHGGATPDITQCSVTVTVVNNETSDFTSAPPLPPLAPSKDPVDTPMIIPDSIIQSVNGHASRPSGMIPSPPTPPAATPIDGNAVICGFATASQIGITILGTTYPNSFIVRTYAGVGGENPCFQQERAFFFKVCHR